MPTTMGMSNTNAITNANTNTSTNTNTTTRRNHYNCILLKTAFLQRRFCNGVFETAFLRLLNTILNEICNSLLGRLDTESIVLATIRRMKT